MAGSSTADLQVVRPAPADSGPCFYLDFAVPEAYLAAERILSLMPAPCEWVPVAAAELPAGGWGAWSSARERERELERLERAASERGLQRVRWPASVPFDSAFALRAATYAKGAGKTVAFSLAAFRQAYAGGRDLAVADNVLIAGAACEIHPRALLQGAATRGVASALARATALARERGVRSVPAVWVAGEVFHGDAELERAAAAVGRP
jgi:2-hydroxychromene-2-carboxylate isomerase